MDPIAAWREIAELCQTGRIDSAVDIAEGLADWLAKGGFPPPITGQRDFDYYVACATCEALIKQKRFPLKV